MAEDMGESHAPSNNNEVKPESKPLNVLLKDQSGNEVHFKIKTTTKFEKVINAYCAKKSLDPATLKFLFDGDRVLPDMMPVDLGMEDNDTIDVVITQLGGAMLRECGMTATASKRQ